MLNILLWILYIILAIIGIILAVVLMVLCLKITLIVDYKDEAFSFKTKIFGIKIDILKVIEKFKNKPEKEKKEKHTADSVDKTKEIKQEIKQEVQQEIKEKDDVQINQDFVDYTSEQGIENELEDNISSNITQKIKDIFEQKDKYLDTLSDILDILNELAFSFYFKNISIDLKIATENACKTGQYVGYFWIIYGNATAFLYNNFLIKNYNVKATPLFEKEKLTVECNGNITICVRLISILRHIKYKKVMEIKRRFF